MRIVKKHLFYMVFTLLRFRIREYALPRRAEYYENQFLLDYWDLVVRGNKRLIEIRYDGEIWYSTCFVLIGLVRAAARDWQQRLTGEFVPIPGEDAVEWC